ncbi:MAG: ABC transporter permease, partial [Gemmatimonadales bacterium]
GRWSLVMLGIIVAAAIVLPPFLQDPAAQPCILCSAEAPSLEHPFGTDDLSRDVLSRVVHGARISLTVASLAVLVSMTLGAAVGLAAGYFGGWADVLLMRFVDGALAIPRLFLLLVLLAVLESVPLWLLILLLGTTGWLGTSRLVRGEVLRIREDSYVLAARALGAARRRIILRHLLPNAFGPLLVAATLAVGDVILLEAGLGFLGIGIRPPTPSWGGMILSARSTFITAPWTSIFPGLAIMLTVLAVNLLGDAFRDAFDPRSA